MKQKQFITKLNQVNMFREIISLILRSTRLVFTVCSKMHRRSCLLATTLSSAGNFFDALYHELQT